MQPIQTFYNCILKEQLCIVIPLLDCIISAVYTNAFPANGGEKGDTFYPILWNGWNGVRLCRYFLLTAKAIKSGQRIVLLHRSRLRSSERNRTNEWKSNVRKSAANGGNIKKSAPGRSSFIGNKLLPLPTHAVNEIDFWCRTIRLPIHLRTHRSQISL